MIYTDKRALDHLNIRNRYDFIYEGIGPYDNFLYSAELEKWNWSSAPYLSPSEMLTLMLVKDQFAPSWEMVSHTSKGLRYELLRRGAKPDSRLFDALFSAMDNDLEYTPLLRPRPEFSPYTDMSLLISGTPLGKALASSVHTNEDFLKLSVKNRDKYVTEFWGLYALKYYYVGNHYKDITGQNNEYFLNMGRTFTIRNHPIYQARKWAAFRRGTLTVDNFETNVVQNHLANRGVLVYRLDTDDEGGLSWESYEKELTVGPVQDPPIPA